MNQAGDVPGDSSTFRVKDLWIKVIPAAESESELDWCGFCTTMDTCGGCTFCTAPSITVICDPIVEPEAKSAAELLALKAQLRRQLAALEEAERNVQAPAPDQVAAFKGKLNQILAQLEPRG